MTAKYKVGEYVTSDNSVFMEIVAVIDGATPIYGHLTPKDADIHWQTEFLFNDQGMHKGVPDFAKYQKLKPGDVLHCGQSQDREYVTVLARVGETCLMSGQPDRKGYKEKTALNKQLKELTGGEVEMFDEGEEDLMKKTTSSSFTSKVATQWKTIDYLCLMNWPIVEE